MLKLVKHADEDGQSSADVDSAKLSLTQNAASDLSPVRFTSVGSGKTRTDLARRREIKFVFPTVDVERVRDLLLQELQRQVHGNRVSEVRSIYFDSPQFAACHANLSGVGVRNKVRIRWYDSLEPQQDFFLEVKWRDNRITGKHRMELQSDRPLHQLSYAQIHRELVRVAPELYTEHLERYREPVVLVEYHREHFVAPGGGMRLTLDYNIQFYDQCGRIRPYARFPIAAHNLVVLEGKTAVGGEARLRSLLEPLGARAHRCSKYVHGCHLIGAVPDTD